MVCVGLVLFLVAIQGFSSSIELLGYAGIGSGAFACFLGVLGAANAQASRASVDSAEYGQQALPVAREPLEVSRQALRTQTGGGEAVTYENLTSKSIEFTAKGSTTSDPPNGINSPDERAPVEEPSSPSPSTRDGSYVHLGRTIWRLEVGYACDGKTFDTLEMAKEYVDNVVALSSPPGDVPTKLQVEVNKAGSS